MKTIVIAWTDEGGLRKTGRNVWRDANWFPEFESCTQARSVIWMNHGTARDIAKARAYAKDCGHDNARVYVYPTTEQDPRGKAEVAVLAIALKGAAS